MATILIVDHAATSRAFLVTPLRHQGHRLVEAANGREGLDAVRAHRPDLVITDVLMPVMDGYEFVKQLRLDPATRTIPVVVSTSYYGEREATALALSGGVADVLTKPVKSAEVLKIVGRVLSGESETKMPPDTSPPAISSDQIRSLTDELAATVNELSVANGRLRAVVDIGLNSPPSATPTGVFRASARPRANCLARRTPRWASSISTKARCCVSSPPEWRHRTGCRPATRSLESSERSSPGGGRCAATIMVAIRSGCSSRCTIRRFRPSSPLPSPHPAMSTVGSCSFGNEGRSFTEDDARLIEGALRAGRRIYELEHEVLERKHVESALRHERNRPQGYLDTADVILVALDLDGRITLINRKGCDLLGWTQQELIGRNAIETCVPDRERESTKQKLSHLFSGDLPSARRRFSPGRAKSG